MMQLGLNLSGVHHPHTNFYPYHAGAKKAGTSMRAAEKITNSGRKASLCNRALEALKAHPDGLASFEIDKLIGSRNIMPRITELCEMGKVVDSGREIWNPETRVEVTVWRAV